MILVAVQTAVATAAAIIGVLCTNTSPAIDLEHCRVETVETHDAADRKHARDQDYHLSDNILHVIGLKEISAPSVQAPSRTQRIRPDHSAADVATP